MNRRALECRSSVRLVSVQESCRWSGVQANACGPCTVKLLPRSLLRAVAVVPLKLFCPLKLSFTNIVLAALFGRWAINSYKQLYKISLSARCVILVKPSALYFFHGHNHSLVGSIVIVAFSNDPRSGCCMEKIIAWNDKRYCASRMCTNTSACTDRSTFWLKLWMQRCLRERYNPSVCSSFVYASRYKTSRCEVEFHSFACWRQNQVSAYGKALAQFSRQRVIRADPHLQACV